MKNRSRTIVVVTDEDETLILEYVELDDLRDEGILPRPGLPLPGLR